MMPRPDAPSVAMPRSWSPAGGMILSIVVGGGLWGGLAIGMHVAGLF